MRRRRGSMKLVVSVARMAIGRNDVHSVPLQRSRTSEVAELTGLVHVRRFLPPTVVTLRSLGATSDDDVRSGGNTGSGGNTTGSGGGTTTSDLTADYASAWQAADKVVYSSTVAAPRTANTRLERHFDPSAVRDVKAAASRDLLVGGPNLAAQALVAGLVDELALFVWPVVLGGPHPRIADERARRSEAHRRAPVQQRRRPPPLSSSVTTQGSPAVAHLPSTAGSRALGGYSDPTLGRHTHFRPQRDG